MWLLGGIFLAAGVASMMSDTNAWRQLWGGLSLMALGGFALAMTWEARIVGRIRIHSTVIDRSARPRTFALVTASVALGGLIVVAVGVWLLRRGT